MKFWPTWSIEKISVCNYNFNYVCILKYTTLLIPVLETMVVLAIVLAVIVVAVLVVTAMVVVIRRNVKDGVIRISYAY
jgi:hypothetical protein